MGSKQPLCSLLEILAVIPEEVENWWLPLTHEDREAVSYQVGLDCGPLFDFLVSCSAAYGQVRCALLTWVAAFARGTLPRRTSLGFLISSFFCGEQSRSSHS